MNAYLRAIFMSVLVLCTLAAAGQGVQNKHIDISTFQGQPITYTIYAANNISLNNINQPDHGTVSIDVPDVGGTAHILTYTPDPDFLGSDAFEVLAVYNTSPPGFTNYFFSVDVIQTQVIARQDYATTSSATPVTLDVLANDESSTDSITVRTIPLANSGNVVIEADERNVTFTPEPGFQGLTYFTYVVCDEVGTCDLGTVNVLVNEDMAADTFRVYTQRNQPKFILAPPFYQWVDGPENGTYDTTGTIPVYTPDMGFVGLDYLIYDDEGYTKVVEVVVLDAPAPNSFAFDDVVYVTPGETVTIDLFDNDGNDGNLDCFAFTQPEYGAVIDPGLSEGVVEYTAPADLSAGGGLVDQFTYSARLPGCLGAPESAEVTVFVSNFLPLFDKFEFVTPKMTPLVVGNGFPIDNYSFSVTDDPQLGSVILLQGDTTIYGVNISGNNAIIYFPNNDVASGQDNFEIEYCISSGGNGCSVTQTIKVDVEILDVGNGLDPSCFGDCVWPGDANNDGLVHVSDLLAIGYVMGEMGTPRDDNDLSVWYGQFGQDWDNAPSFKYVDTDGDSVITAQDTFAIRAFYGNTHALVPNLPLYSNVQVELNEITQGPYQPGDLVQAELVLGSESNPILDMYGFTFPFSYNPMIFQPESIQVNYPGSWFTYNSPILNMTFNDLEGLLEAGVTRTNGISADGEGPVATLSFIVDEDIAGFRPGEPIRLGGGTGSGMNSAGQFFGFSVPELDIQIVSGEVTSTEEPLQKPLSSDLLRVYPNPSRDRLELHFNGGYEFRELRIFDASGRQLHFADGLAGRHQQINVSNYMPGLYVVQVLTDAGLVRKKFEVVR